MATGLTSSDISIPACHRDNVQVGATPSRHPLYLDSYSHDRPSRFPSLPWHLRRSVSPEKQPRTDNMANEQISLPYFLGVLVFAGLVIRYLFFSGTSSQPTTRSPEAFLRSREVAVERIQQMFPQTDRRSILWDLQRNGGNIQSTTERILSGRLELVSTIRNMRSHARLLLAD